ncbi:MAG TPA: HAD family hydrolase [Alphaproteobacteria bacterium]|jgi:phosphoglycolate phosphatase
MTRGGGAGIGPPPAPAAILFDWDNTLVDNWPAIHDALNATFAAMGHESWTLEETKARVRKSLRDSFPEMFGEAWREARRVFYARYGAVHLGHLTPLPGAGETLAWLDEAGLYLGVVSNKAGRYLRAEAACLGWDRHFDAIVGATDAAEDKPAVAPVRLALAAGGPEPGPRVWFVGDGAIDVQCALNAGLTPIVIGGSRTEEELVRHNVDQFVGPQSTLPGLDGLKALVSSACRPISGG